MLDFCKEIVYWSTHTQIVITQTVFNMTRVFVTVGTTEFDELIPVVTSSKILKLLHDNGGYTEMTVQIGRGKYKPEIRPTDPIKVTVYDFKPSLHQDMVDADLIITHCGAGSLMESLGLRKPTVAVVNKSLWDNHQSELAAAFSSDNHLASSTPEELAELFLNKRFFTDTLK
jgi:beta-1,4-N-acetylglucosaminyltransferase